MAKASISLNDTFTFKFPQRKEESSWDEANKKIVTEFEPFSLQSDRFAFARCLERTRGVDLLTQNNEMLAPPYIESVRRGFQ